MPLVMIIMMRLRVRVRVVGSLGLTVSNSLLLGRRERLAVLADDLKGRFGWISADCGGGAFRRGGGGGGLGG